MRLAGLCMLVAVGAVSQPARAEPPVSGAALGQVEALIEHCGQFNAASAERLRALARGLTGGATEDELAEARSSAEYRDAHDAVSGQLPDEVSEKACVEGAAVGSSR
jgi:hypothetical protein